MTARLRDERGVALITTLMIMMLMSALMIGFTATVASDQKYRLIDRDRGRAFYAAHSGLEKLNAELAGLFFVNVAPTNQQIDALSQTPPTIPDVTFLDEDPGAYGVEALSGINWGTISTGPYTGLMALKKTYDLTSSAKTTWGGEAHLRRRVETVAIPVFQFGMFSEVDLSFSAADNFDFGGRVHTNRNLFLAQGGGAGSTLTLRDRVTAVGEIIRKRLSNGESIAVSGSTRAVSMARAPGAFRNLLDTEGSREDGLTSALNNAWPTISLSTYNGYIRNGRTGARRLDLPLITTGGANADLVRRPAANENLTNAVLLGERYFSKVSLRILLSDTAADITSLPGITPTPPVALDGDWIANPPNNGVAYGPVGTQRPPVARTVGPASVSVTGGAIAVGNNQTIPVNAAVPAAFRLPALTLTNNVTGISYALTCQTKPSATQLGVCSVPAGAAVNIPANMGSVTGTLDGVAFTTPTTNALVINAAGQIDSNGGGCCDNAVAVVNAVPLSRNTLSIGNTNNLLTCAGYDNAPSFRACNVTTAIANNTVLSTHALSAAGTGTLGGFIKIERQDVNGVWSDVTMEILNWGIAGPNLVGKGCGDPTPNAILRLQRLRDNNELAGWPGVNCSYSTIFRSTDYWPNVLFDSREGVSRDAIPAGAPLNIRLGGVMHYVALDVRNLSRWFQGVAPYLGSSGPNSKTDNGFSVYFSDRRNNRNANNLETGEYGFEDFVNPLSPTGAANAQLDEGEDVNENTLLEGYGQFPVYNGAYNSVPPGAIAPLDLDNARPWANLNAGQAKVNRAVLFRRALKLINGSLGNIVAPGFTVASENPVYVQGDWNANAAGWGDPHVATSIVADAVTMLSNQWNDNLSFAWPYVSAQRVRGGHTWYRVAIISGKSRIFPRPSNGEGATYGTDGGAHSFLRFLEGAGGANTVHYRGSMATFYYSRQAVSPFKCCGGVVYDVPVRDYSFDTDFLDPARLPPLTPVFRDLNALGFWQETRTGF